MRRSIGWSNTAPKLMVSMLMGSKAYVYASRKLTSAWPTGCPLRRRTDSTICCAFSHLASGT